MSPFSRSVAAAVISCVVCFCGYLVPQLSWAGETKDHSALLQALSKTQMTLAEGLKQVTQGTEVPISAKFELDDNQRISLSIYTAEKGLGMDSEHNILKELAGSPEKAPWMPEVEVFKDIPHVARASAHLTLTAIARHSLLAVVLRAEKEHPGKLFSIAPRVHKARAVFAVLIANGSNASEYLYDALTGKQVP